MAEEVVTTTTEEDADGQETRKLRKLVVALEPHDYKLFKQYAISQKRPITEVAREILAPYLNR